MDVTFLGNVPNHTGSRVFDTLLLWSQDIHRFGPATEKKKCAFDGRKFWLQAL
jgi:hypothetical protein